MPKPSDKKASGHPGPKAREKTNLLPTASASLEATEPRRRRQGGCFQSGAEFGQGTVVVLVGVVRAELVAEFVKDEAIRILGHAVGEPLLAKNADVVIERRETEQVAGAVTSSPRAAVAPRPMDESDHERFADQTLGNAVRVIENLAHPFRPF